MSTKTSFLAVSFAIVQLPWLLWRIGLVRRVAPLDVGQILVGVVLGTRIGQTALALVALNDAALWAMLAALLAFAGTQDAANGLLSLGVAVAQFGLVIVVIRRAFARLAAASDQAVLVAGASLAILSAGAIMPATCRTFLLDRLETVTATSLLPFFFMSTGLKALIEPGSASYLGLLVVAVAATVLGKLAGTALPAHRAGFSWAESPSLGVMMQTKGLMEVVVLTTLHDAELIGAPIFSGMVAMAVVCTVLTAPAVQLCQRLKRQRESGPSMASKTS